MSTELKMAAAESTAIVPVVSDAERRVQRAKAQLRAHLAALDQRARLLARQGAWVAGMVLLGFVGVAAATSMFRRRPRRVSRMYHSAERHPRQRGGLGIALTLAAFGLLTGARSLAPHRARGYEARNAV